MGPLQDTHVGWENERLAEYLLSRFCFIAHPATIGDDIGADFFCTLFESTKIAQHFELLPRGTFAIQIKSDNESINVDNKFEFFSRLEIPFFIGVADNEAFSLEIYSCEFIPQLIALAGHYEGLNLKLCNNRPSDSDEYYKRKGVNSFTLFCPYVDTLNIKDQADELRPKVEKILNICERTQRNIASRINGENLYFQDDFGQITVIAGPGSIQVFKDNFFYRLTEAIGNLHWLINNINPSDKEREQFIREFEFFDRCQTEFKKVHNVYADEINKLCEEIKNKLIKS